MSSTHQTKKVTFEEIIQEFLIEQFSGESDTSFSDSAPLAVNEGGFLDSLGIQMLLVHFEDTLEIELQEEDIVPDTFRSIKAFAEVLRMRAPQSDFA